MFILFLIITHHFLVAVSFSLLLASAYCTLSLLGASEKLSLALSTEFCSLPETQQTGGRPHSQVYLSAWCVLNTKNSFDLVDIKSKLLSCKPKYCLGKTSVN